MSMKKLLSVLLALALFASLLCAAAEESAETPAEKTVYSKTWLCGPSYGYSTAVAVLVVTNDPARKEMTPEQVAEEIRFIPFDGDAGIYGTGNGEPAGEKAEITSLSDSRTAYTVRLNAPGKYLLSGAAYYLFDPRVPALSALRAELDGIAEGSRKNQDKQTAKALHDWLIGRVSSVIPEEDAERLGAACTDPVNALLTGYACREAYAPAYRMLLNAAGIRCLAVSGTAGEEDASWSLCRLDGTWCWTDAAMDDRNDKKGSKYLSVDDKAIGKDHALCAADEAFTAEMIRTPAIDAVLSGALDPSRLKVYEEWDRNLDLLVSEGPAWVVGDSATVSYRLYSNHLAEYRQMTPEEFLEKTVAYAPWLEEDHFYYSDACTISEESYRYPEIPPLSEMITVEEMAEDKSSFTLTFHVPGRYILMEYFSQVFYLISPDQAEPAAMAAEMGAVVEKAKAAGTEKQAAKILFNWIRGKVKYNYPAWKPWENPVTDRDMQTCADAVGALLYGKCVCSGYAMIYAILMQQAGLRQFFVNGFILPSNEGHAWNVNRLDGVWSQTDVTHGRFDWSHAKMSQNREYLHWKVMEGFFFGNGFDLLADEAEEDYKPLAVLPLALKHLPLDAADYGFPEISEKDLISAELTPLNQNVRVTVPKAAKIRISKWKDGKRIGTASESEKAVKEYTARFTSQGSLLVEILTYDNLPKLGKPALCTVLYYTDGELTGTGARYYVPVKKNEYPGFNEYSYRYYELDGQLKPLSVGWYMNDNNWDTYDIRVCFGADGKAERYRVNYERYYKNVFDWEGTPEEPLTRIKDREVEDPSKEDPTRWEAIWFE